jgi:hypothetical protein
MRSFRTTIFLLLFVNSAWAQQYPYEVAPLASLPRGRAGSGFDLDLAYDSHFYDIYPHTIPPRPPNEEPVFVQELSGLDTTGGWRYNITNYRLEGETRTDVDISCPNNGPYRIYRFRIGLPDGSLHVLHLKGYGEELPNEQYEGDGFFGIKPDGRPPSDRNEFIAGRGYRLEQSSGCSRNGNDHKSRDFYARWPRRVSTHRSATKTNTVPGNR